MSKIEVKNLDHLGIVAGIIDEIGIEEIINSKLGRDGQEKMTSGQIVKAILLNGLGFVSRPLYLFSQFFEDKGVEELLGKGVENNLRWIFQCFQGIHLVTLNEVKQIVNLTEERRFILNFLPSSCQKYYLSS